MFNETLRIFTKTTGTCYAHSVKYPCLHAYSSRQTIEKNGLDTFPHIFNINMFLRVISILIDKKLHIAL